jgi:hypothetical protein
MSSILGEKYRYATASEGLTSSIANIDVTIAQVTKALSDATGRYNRAIAAIASCDNKARKCVDKTGKHISTWREMRDSNKKLRSTYTDQLADLNAKRQALIEAQNTSASSAQVVAEADKVVAAANTKLAEAESVTTDTNAKKIALYGGLALAGITITLVIIKVLKKKK